MKRENLKKAIVLSESIDLLEKNIRALKEVEEHESEVQNSPLGFCYVNFGRMGTGFRGLSETVLSKDEFSKIIDVFDTIVEERRQEIQSIGVEL